MNPTERSSAERSTAVPLWRDVRVLTLLSQIVFVLAVAVVAGFLYANVSAAMSKRGLAAGLGFLSIESGFEIGEGLIPYRPSDTYGRAFLVGVANTLLISGVGIALATILGILVGIARLSTNWLVNRLAAVYIEIIRNTPLLVQLVFVYFAVFITLPPVQESLELPGSVFANQRGVFIPRPVPSDSFSVWLLCVAVGLVTAILLATLLPRFRPRLRYSFIPGSISVLALILIPALGWVLLPGAPLTLDLPVRGRFNFIGGLALSPEFSALLTGLVLYTAAFIAEVVRGGIQSVRRGQIEAAHALGLTSMQSMWLIVFPQALRVIIPPLTSQYLNLAKNSSLAIAIGFPDLFSVGSTIANQTGQPVPVITLIMATYLAMSLFTSLLMNLYNRRVQILEK
jgi:general L-amino acid transport system permease protein